MSANTQTMPTIDCDTFKRLAEDHEKWLSTNGKEGQRLELKRSIIKDARMIDLDLSESRLTGCDFNNCYWERVSFDRAIWGDVLVNGGKMHRVSFQEADLRSLTLCNVECRRLSFAAASLLCGRICDSYMHRCDFQDANLGHAGIVDTRFHQSNLHQTVLDGTTFIRVYLDEHTVRTRPVTTLSLGTWEVWVMRDVTRIGCKVYRNEAWINASDGWISGLDPKALSWWKEHRSVIIPLIEHASKLEADYDIIRRIQVHTKLNAKTV